MISYKVLGRFRPTLFLALPLILSAYTHLWNPVGFPAIWVVEGQYMQRAMQMLEGEGLHEPRNIFAHFYDHPFFGQLFLESVRVRFLFVFLKFPSPNEHRPALITSHLRRIASCSKSYLWGSEDNSKNPSLASFPVYHTADIVSSRYLSNNTGVWYFNISYTIY